MIKMIIEVDVNVAPRIDGARFKSWCKENNFDYLGGGRRAWCHEFQTYFRNAIGVATTKSGEQFLVYQDDLGLEDKSNE